MKALKHSFLIVLLCCASVAPLRAQIPTPTPPVDPHSYIDLGMEYHTPDNAYLVGKKTRVLLADLQDSLAPVAVWAIDPGKENFKLLQISMESFEGPPDQWEGQFESQTHGSQDGVLIRNKTPMSLTNGMPATFVELTFGSGFDARKEYAVVWADGSRGIVLSITTRIGDISEEDAKSIMHNVKAVRYPVNQEPQPDTP